MLTHNLDTSDGLMNGAFGQVLGYDFDKDGLVQGNNVNFTNPNTDKERRISRHSNNITWKICNWTLYDTFQDQGHIYVT